MLGAPNKKTVEESTAFSKILAETVSAVLSYEDVCKIVTYPPPYLGNNIKHFRRQSILPKDPRPKMQSSTRLIPCERSRHRYLRNTSAVTKRQTAVQYPHHMTRHVLTHLWRTVIPVILPIRPTAQRLTLTLEAYMNQQANDTVIERRAPGNRADIRFIRLKEVMAICGKSRSSVYDAIKRGAFPRPVKLQGQSTAWIKSEVEQGLCSASVPAAETVSPSLPPHCRAIPRDAAAPLPLPPGPAP